MEATDPQPDEPTPGATSTDDPAAADPAIEDQAERDADQIERTAVARRQKRLHKLLAFAFGALLLAALVVPFSVRPEQVSMAWGVVGMASTTLLLLDAFMLLRVRKFDEADVPPPLLREPSPPIDFDAATENHSV